MATALTRFGQYCRDLRIAKNKSMGDQAEAFRCDVHYISSVEVGKTKPHDGYVDKFRDWLHLNETQHADLLKRAKSNVVEFRQRVSTSNNSQSMRLFRKVSQMDPNQIRKFREKIKGEAEDD